MSENTKYENKVSWPDEQQSIHNDNILETPDRSSTPVSLPELISTDSPQHRRTNTPTNSCLQDIINSGLNQSLLERLNNEADDSDHDSECDSDNSSDSSECDDVSVEWRVLQTLVKSHNDLCQMLCKLLDKNDD